MVQVKDGSRIERLVEKFNANRKSYNDSIRGKKVWVRPSVPDGGVVGFKIVVSSEEEQRMKEIYEELVRKRRDGGK